MLLSAHNHGLERASGIERRSLHALQPSEICTRSKENHCGELRIASQPETTATMTSSSKKQGGAPAHLTAFSARECIAEHADVLSHYQSERVPPRMRAITIAHTSCGAPPEAPRQASQRPFGSRQRRVCADSVRRSRPSSPAFSAMAHPISFKHCVIGSYKV